MTIRPVVLLIVLILAVLAQRILELRMADRNHRKLLEGGAVEYGAGHYPLFFLLHGGWLAGWIVEAWLRGPRLAPGWLLWLLLLGCAEILRYWTLSTLGERWTTHIVVLPGERPARAGPYRLLPHPNYLAVALELAAVPMLFGAWITALVSSVLDAGLLLGIRIPAEKKAWRTSAD